MAHPNSLIATLKDAAGLPVAQSTLPLGSVLGSLLAAVGEAGSVATRGASLDLHWLSPTGERAHWCSISQIDHGALALAGSISARDLSKAAYRLDDAHSLRLMPDYGAAAVWNPHGACSDLEPRDYVSCAEGDAEAFEDQIQTWQAHFEFFCDAELTPPKQPCFDWRPFSSKAAALALRSRALLLHPLHVEEAWENTGARSVIPNVAPERERDTLWIPEWEDGAPLARRASHALERLDEAQFIQAWKEGARQESGAPMPWSVYCAHMRLGRALEAIVQDEPRRAADVCAWGCSPFDASMFVGDPRGLSIALSAAGAALEPPGEGWCQALVRRRSLILGDDALACLGLLLAAGEPMPAPEWMAKQRPGPQLSALAAGIEAIVLGRSVPGQAPSSRPKAL